MPKKRIVFTLGGEATTGKTTFMRALADWYKSNQIPCAILTPPPRTTSPWTPQQRALVLLDAGLPPSPRAKRLFDEIYSIVGDFDVALTAAAIITTDQKSVESLLRWATVLQDRVDYLVVENAITAIADFTVWHHATKAQEFRQVFDPACIAMEFRPPDIQNAIRTHGLAPAPNPNAPVTPTQQLSSRLEAYRTTLFTQFERIAHILLP